MSQSADMNSQSALCVRGFVLQCTYRIIQGKPVVYAFGRLDDQRTFLIRDSNQTPHFFVPAEHADQVRSAHVASNSRRALDGQSLVKVSVDLPSAAPAVRDALHGLGIATFEADVRFAMRYLIDRNIRGGIEISGPAQPGQGVDLVFDNPVVASARVEITPRVLSFDIETNPNTDRLLAIACYGCGVDEVVVVNPQTTTLPEKVIAVADERSALDYFCDLVRRLDVDVLTGWNVIDFDLSFLARVAARVRFDLQLGRHPGGLRIREAQGYFGSGHATIPGRLVLDGLDLLRGAFIKMDEYSLDAVSQQVLGEGKTFSSKGRDKVSDILESYAEDLQAFAFYARTDARLALQIVQQLDLVELAFARSQLTGMPADRVAASIASFDFLYISELVQRDLAAPSVGSPGLRPAAQGGGAVFEPQVGIHSNVWVCDFKSLYPSIIRTFNIDPLTYVQAGQAAPGEIIQTQDGTAFARDAGILPGLLDRFFPAREAAKQRGDQVASQAIKILMNSFYGVLGTPACRFYNPQIANAITGQGRYLLQWSRDWFGERGFEVLYGDTDSVFVASGEQDPEIANRLAGELVSQFNAELTQHLADEFRVASKLELEFEKLYTQLFLARARGSSSGARKRYAGVRLGQEEVEFVGMEVVRRDWTELAKAVQRNLFERLFSGAEVAHYLAEVVAQLRDGKLNRDLIYRKGLRKELGAYTTNVPPHVQAVRKSQRPPPRVVEYVMTVAGPERVDDQQHTVDLEHYLQKQIRPVAEPVLEALQLDFEQVIGDDRQIELF